MLTRSKFINGHTVEIQWSLEVKRSLVVVSQDVFLVQAGVPRIVAESSQKISTTVQTYSDSQSFEFEHICVQGRRWMQLFESRGSPPYGYANLRYNTFMIVN